MKEDSKEQIVHKCDDCGKKFKKKKDLRGHKNAGHHSCVHIVKSFNKKSNLKVHILNSHTTPSLVLKMV